MEKETNTSEPHPNMISPVRVARLYVRNALGRRFNTVAISMIVLTMLFCFVPQPQVTTHLLETFHVPILSSREQAPLSQDEAINYEAQNTPATDYDHQATVHLPRTPLYKKQCEAVSGRTLERLADEQTWMTGAHPVSLLFTHGDVVDRHNYNFAAGAEFCGFVFVPQSAPPPTYMGHHANRPIHGWGPDGLHVEVRSADVALIPQHPRYWGSLAITRKVGGERLDLAIYNFAFTLDHPGEYRFTGELEFRNWDWVMEDPIDLTKEDLGYEMLNETIEAKSPAVSISGLPKSRPSTKCFFGEHNDVQGRWYRAAAFKRGGRMTQLNAAAHLEFAEYNTTTDEWGWTFAPDDCSLEFFTPEDHLSCLRDRTVQVLGDSNSRRVFKSIIGGGVAWCQDPENRICQCEDHYQTDFLDAKSQTINASRFQNIDDRENPTVWGDNSNLYFDYVGGLMNKKLFNPWEYFYDSSQNSSSLIQKRIERHGGIDVVHVSLLGWDMASIRTTQEILDHIDNFRTTLFSAYPAGTRFVTRLANSNCCGNINHRTRYSGPRFAIWNAMWRKYWEQDEMSKLVRAIDVTALQGRYDAETAFFCPTTHLRNSHVRIEQMMWMGAVCEKINGKPATMRNWEASFPDEERKKSVYSAGHEEV